MIVRADNFGLACSKRTIRTDNFGLACSNRAERSDACQSRLLPHEAGVPYAALLYEHFLGNGIKCQVAFKGSIEYRIYSP